MLVFVHEVIAENLWYHTIDIPFLDHPAANLGITCYVCQNPQTLRFLKVRELDLRISGQKSKQLQNENFTCLYHIVDLVILRVNSQVSNSSQHKYPGLNSKLRIVKILNDFTEVVNIDYLHVIISSNLCVFSTLQRGCNYSSLECLLHVRPTFSLNDLRVFLFSQWYCEVFSLFQYCPLHEFLIHISRMLLIKHFKWCCPTASKCL